MRLTYLLLAAMVATGCGDTAAFGDSFQDDDLPMGNCPGTTCPESTAGDTGGAAGSPCDGTNQCAEGVCAAPFDDGEIGTLVCQNACIEPMDEARWCSDAAACCDSNALCSSRGFCIPQQDADATGADSESSGDTSPDDTSSTAGTETGSGSGSGSDTAGSDSSGSGSSSGDTTAGTGA